MSASWQGPAGGTKAKGPWANPKAKPKAPAATRVSLQARASGRSVSPTVRSELSESERPPFRERSGNDAAAVAESYAAMRPEAARVEAGRPRLRVSPCSNQSSSQSEGIEVRLRDDAADDAACKPIGNASGPAAPPAPSSLSLVIGACLGCLSTAQGAGPRPRIEGQGKGV